MTGTVLLHTSLFNPNNLDKIEHYIPITLRGKERGWDLILHVTNIELLENYLLYSLLLIITTCNVVDFKSPT